MQINVNTDNTIDKHQGLDDHVESVVQSSIGRFSDQVTRVDVHLSNENKQKKADGGQYCMMEARVSGYAPVVVHEHSADLHQAVQNAGSKLARALDSALGRLQDKNKHTSPAVDDPLSDKHLTDS